MAIKHYKPITNGRRNMTGYDFSEITTDKPEKTLLDFQKQHAGRVLSGSGGQCAHGRVVSRAAVLSHGRP